MAARRLRRSTARPMSAWCAPSRLGRYAVRIVFDDGHDTGLYSWDFLYELGRDKERFLREYRARLSAREIHPDA